MLQTAQFGEPFTEIGEAARTIRGDTVLVQCAGYLGGDPLKQFFILSKPLLGVFAFRGVPDNAENQLFALIEGAIGTDLCIRNSAVLAAVLGIKMRTGIISGQQHFLEFLLAEMDISVPHVKAAQLFGGIAKHIDITLVGPIHTAILPEYHHGISGLLEQGGPEYGFYRFVVCQWFQVPVPVVQNPTL